MSLLSSPRPHTSGLFRAFLLLTCTVISGCGTTEPDADELTLEGVWRITVAGEFEATVELRSDGTFDEVEASFAQETCSTASGTWSSDGGVLSVTISSRNGAPASESEDIPFDLSPTALTLNHAGDEPETLTRIDAMVDCTSYGWPTITLSASVDGVPITFEDHVAPVLGPGQTLAELVGSGSLVLAGRDGSGAPPAECEGCRELTIDLMRPSGLVTGTYSMSADNVSGLTARATYTPDLSSTVAYWSEGSDPAEQAWEGEVVITVASATELSGTFSFVGYNHLEPGPVWSSVSVTNGAFRISFE